MQKPKRKSEPPDPTLKDDPRPKDVVAWNRVRNMVLDEACHQDWGCALYRLHRNGLIKDEQREAGDSYFKLIDGYNKAQEKDPDTMTGNMRNGFLRKLERTKRRREEVIDILGMGRGLLDALVFGEEYPATERQRVFIKAMLAQLAVFFNTGRRKARP